MKRWTIVCAALVALCIPAFASAQDLSFSDDWKTMATWRPLWMRNTNQVTAVTPQNRNWAFGQFGAGNVTGFTDSTVFRRGATTATVYDTSAAYPREQFPFPPHWGPGSFAVARGDTLLPWLVLRVGQDTTAYSFSGTSGLDSVRIAIEYSYDGIDWFSMSGTPTIRFDTVYLTSGADGLQSPTVIGVEGTPGEDKVVVQFKCGPTVNSSANSYIVTQTACLAGNYLRFIIGMDASGQFKAEYMSWKRD